ncbi:MAG: peptide MFS transporter [Sphingomonadales bacterium]|nr:peptide MFS transporter [Sphingomonadales bacterium]
MTAPEATPELAPPHDRAFLGHPKGLGYLSLTEGCERFSYYSMQTLLVLYMVKYLLLPERMAGVAGLETLRTTLWGGLTGQPLASAIFGTYTALVYMTPIAGGFIADVWLGRRRTLVLGGAVMALGHFLMAFEGSFLIALLALIVGVGLFKGNIASQVGELYGPNDLRRAMAFQIFYTAINASVIIAPLVSGTLGEKVGWHWGFGAAGVVMVLGLLVYLKAAPWLPADQVPGRKAAGARGGWLPGDGARVAAIVILVPVMACAMITNQEIFNAYLVWADRAFQLTFFGVTLPTSFMITIDAAFSFSMLVAVAAFWQWWGKTRREPDELGKMIIGAAFSILGGLCLVVAAATQGSGKIGLFWPAMFHLLNSIGFAHMLPVSLALFSRLAPKPIEGTVIGIYYLAFFAANALVGKIGGLLDAMPVTRFWLLHVGCATLAFVAFALFRMVLAKRLMGSPVTA